MENREQIYKACEHLLRAVHVLIAIGQGDGPEADLIRETMEILLEKLPKEDEEKLANLSGDIYEGKA